MDRGLWTVDREPPIRVISVIRGLTAFLILSSDQTEIFKNLRARRDFSTSDHPYFI
jgi:hypothetical protein